ncbi:MAG: hypothetical protein Q9212_005425 [Teloschistes hypoglaucus]
MAQLPKLEVSDALQQSCRRPFTGDPVTTEELPRPQRPSPVHEELVVYHEKSLWPAILHSELRAEKIREAPPEMYAHMPTRGFHELDVTSYWPNHHDWGFLRRNDRPDVLFQFLPRAKQDIPYPGVMFFQGKIVIDEDRNPIVDWPIPFCLSSQVEGGRLEAMARQNGNKITKEDFKARMPSAHLTKEGGRKVVVTSGALGMRRLRFRDQAGLLAFDGRDGSVSRKRAIIQCIPLASMVNVILTNSTKGLTDLSTEAQNYVICTNRGTNPGRAGQNRVTVEERKIRHTKTDELLQCFEPPNPIAWPYGRDIMDDRQAIATARAYLSKSSPVGSAGILPTNHCREVEKGMSGSLMLETRAKQSQDDNDDRTINVSTGSFKRRRLDEQHQGRDLAPEQLSGAFGSRQNLGGAEQMLGAFDSKNRRKTHRPRRQKHWSSNSPIGLENLEVPGWIGATTDFGFLEPETGHSVKSQEECRDEVDRWQKAMLEPAIPKGLIRSSARVGEGRGAPASLSGTIDPPWSYSIPSVMEQREITSGSSGRRDAMKSRYYRLRKDDRAPAVNAETEEDFLAPLPPFEPFSAPAMGLEKVGGPPAVEAGTVEDLLAPIHTPSMDLEKAGGTPAVEAKSENFLAPATRLEDLKGDEAEFAQFLAEFSGFSDADWRLLGM